MNLKLSSKSVKSSLKHHHNKSKVIAIIGTSSGVGVTHTSILLANFLRRQKLKVAIIEGNPSGHMAKLEKVYEGAKFDPELTDWFSIKQVDYYKSCTLSRLNEVYEKNYDVIVIDIGSDPIAYKDIFKNADYPLVVGHSVDWKQFEHRDLIESHQDLLTNRISWLIPFGGVNDIRMIQKKLGYPCCLVGFSLDPFVKDKIIDQRFRKLLKLR